MEDYVEHIGHYVQDNYLQLKVYFGSKSVEQVLEMPKYNVFTFLSSLGGAISVYLGMSFIVIFELLEIVLRLCLNAVGFSRE